MSLACARSPSTRARGGETERMLIEPLIDCALAVRAWQARRRIAVRRARRRDIWIGRFLRLFKPLGRRLWEIVTGLIRLSYSGSETAQSAPPFTGLTLASAGVYISWDSSDCSIKLYTVTSNVRSKPSRRRSLPTRALALLLFALIIHGATVEMAHTHGGPSIARGVVECATPSASDSGDADSSSQQARTRSECVICQLHQQLSITLFNSLPWTAPPPARSAPHQASSNPYFSLASTAQRGRAPPLASLL